MMNVRFALRLVFALIFAAVSAGGAARAAGADILRSDAEGLAGEDRLRTFSRNYELTAELGDPFAEIAALYPYLAEARRRNDDSELAYALVQRLCFFFNNDMEDSLLHYYPESMEFFRRKGRWDSYYYSALLVVESLMYSNRPVMAMSRARELYAEADTKRNRYGRGAAAYLIGKVNKYGGNYAEALGHLTEAVELLDGEPDPTILFRAYDALWECYYDQGLYGDALDVLRRFEQAVTTTEESLKRKGDFVSQKATRFYCDCGFVQVYSRLRRAVDAELYLEKARRDSVGLHVYTDFLHIAESVYHEEKGDYNEALAALRRSFPPDGFFSDAREGYIQSVRLAKLLKAAGRHNEAAGAYEQAMVFSDRLQNIGLNTQIQEMERLFALEQEKRHARNLQMLTGMVVLALMALFTVNYIYSYRLRRKNAALSDQLREVNRLRSWQLAHLAPANDAKGTDEAEANHRKNEELVWLACRKMVEEKLFCNPSLNRKQLADLLGTNENYLAAAIRDVNGGQTVGDFINGFRLDYACGLLTGNPEMTLDNVAQESGLVTRSTLFRLFLKKFGMSPSRYRTDQAKGRQSE